MKFNTKELNPGAWFWFDDDKPEDGGVCLRRVNSKKLAEIHKKTRKTAIEFRRRIRYENETVNEEKEGLMLWDYCIVDWKVVEDDDGNMIEPTAENKSMLMNESPNFAGFVTDCLERLDKSIADREEGAPKN